MLHFSSTCASFPQLNCYQSFPWFSYKFQVELCCIPHSNHLQSSAYLKELLWTLYGLYLSEDFLFSFLYANKLFSCINIQLLKEAFNETSQGTLRNTYYYFLALIHSFQIFFLGCPHCWNAVMLQQTCGTYIRDLSMSIFLYVQGLKFFHLFNIDQQT